MINWLDFVLLAMLFYSVVGGWRRGLIRQLFDIIGILAAYYFALNYSLVFMTWLDQYIPLTRWLPDWFGITLPGGLVLGDVLVRLVGFVLLFMIVRFVVRAAATVLHGIFSLPLLGTINAIGGFALGAVKGVLLVMIMVGLLSLITTPFWMNTLRQSVVAQLVMEWLPVVYEHLRETLLIDLLPA